MRAIRLGIAVGGLALASSMLLSGGVNAAAEVHLTAAGDFGARAATSTVLTRTAQLAPDAALALGDLSYRDAVPETAWCSYVKARIGEGFPFQLLAGNHDSLDVNDGDINDFSSCLPNQIPGVVGTYGREYYFDLPKGDPLVRVIMASPGLTFEDGKWNYSQADAHHTWLSNAIDGGRAAGAKWIVVSAHIPCLSVGGYNCPTNRDFYDLLLSKKVDLVLHGHEHAYMRTHQLRSGVSGCPALVTGSVDPDCIADSDSAMAAGAGTVFATVGTGGTPLRDVNASDTEAGYFASFTGLNREPTYGLLDLRLTDAALTAKFEPTSGSATDAFTISLGEPPANQPPVAAFTVGTSGLAATVNGSGSTDPDGTIASYSWDFGDGQSATGATPAAHTYAQAGTYAVTLTVTDNQGATNAVTRQVTVTQAPPPVAADEFARTLASGWGSAQTGGAWTVNTASAFSVAGYGRISTAPATTRQAYLRSVAAEGTDARFRVSTESVASADLRLSFAGRSVPGVGDYRTKLRMRSDGRLSLSLVRTNASGTETYVASDVLVPSASYSAGAAVEVRAQVSGTGPTTLRAKAWQVGAAEPTAWLVSGTDATTALQVPGSIGFLSYLSSSATAAVATRVDNLLVTTG